MCPKWGGITFKMKYKSNLMSNILVCLCMTFSTKTDVTFRSIPPLLVGVAPFVA